MIIVAGELLPSRKPKGRSAHVPSNGELNSKFGVYKSVCCGAEIVITEGTTFPTCPNHPKHPAQWKLVSDNVAPPSEGKTPNSSPAA